MQVACGVPSSGRGASPSSAASTPAPAVAGACTIGQASRQPPWHVLGPWASGTNMYSVMPAPLTRIGPSDDSATATVSPAVAAGAAAAVVTGVAPSIPIGVHVASRTYHLPP